MLTIVLLDAVVYKFKLIILTLAVLLGGIIDLYKSPSPAFRFIAMKSVIMRSYEL